MYTVLQGSQRNQLYHILYPFYPFCPFVVSSFTPFYPMNCRAACESSCSKVGATLPVIRSLDENEEVKKLVPSTSK